MKESFIEVKNRVLNIISKNKHKVVNRKTDMKKAGIYMLYVDCFDDDRIIPFYIGQTNDFQERHKQHFCEMLSLNRLESGCYKYALLNGLYNGHYRPCKIFSYMVNHNCEIKDLQMIVLEEIEDEKERQISEHEYINELLAPFVGFNQMHCVSRYVDYSYGTCKATEFNELLDYDFKHLKLYSDYGYNIFNWFLANGLFDGKQKEEILSSGVSDSYAKILEHKKRLTEIKIELVDIRDYNGHQCEREIWEICKSDIVDFFSKNGLRSEDKQKLVVRVLLFGFDHDKKTLNKYFERYMKNITSNILDILNEKYIDVIEPIKERILSNQTKYEELIEEKSNISEKVYSWLLPIKSYKSHPLKSMYEKFQFPLINGENNVCYINIEYTCFKGDYYNNFYPVICKIDYHIVRDGVTHSREVFIKNQLENFFKTDDVYYCEKGFRNGPFNIYLVGNIDTHIPVSMEYRNGINEYTLCNVDVEDEFNVFKEIDALIDTKTKIVYTTSGHKSTIKRYSEIAESKNIIVLKRLIRQC